MTPFHQYHIATQAGWVTVWARDLGAAVKAASWHDKGAA